MTPAHTQAKMGSGRIIITTKARKKSEKKQNDEDDGDHEETKDQAPHINNETKIKEPDTKNVNKRARE